MQTLTHIRQVHSAKLEVESMQSEAAAAHSDLEVCALEINRLQELYTKEREEKEGLARELQVVLLQRFARLSR